jgi:nucleoside-diphosphate-sugar epimerase
VHIEDISGAILAGLEAPRETIHNQVFNIGSTMAGRGEGLRAVSVLSAPLRSGLISTSA